MNMMTRFSPVFQASRELGGDGALLVGFLGRGKDGSPCRNRQVKERRIRRRSRVQRT